MFYGDLNGQHKKLSVMLVNRSYTKELNYPQSTDEAAAARAASCRPLASPMQSLSRRRVSILRSIKLRPADRVWVSEPWLCTMDVQEMADIHIRYF